MRCLSVRSFLLLLAGCALFACAPAPKQAKLRVVWPLPPDPPRLEWLGTYASEDDFPKTDAQRRMESIVGKPPVNRFRAPFGITADGKGLVYISDSISGNLLVYDLNTYAVEFFADPNPFVRPAGLAMDAAGNLYVADLDQRVVQVFGPDRRPLRTIGQDDDLRSPSYLAIDERRDRLYVSDSRANRILVYTRAGTKLQQIGPELKEGKKIANPQGLAIDADGNLYVAMLLSSKIAVLSPEGELLKTFGERGDQVYQFEAPKALAFDSDHNLWVIDNRRNTILTYNTEGRVLLSTGGKDTRGDSPLAFVSPVSIYIDRNDKIYVTDRLLQRFSVWQYFNDRYQAEHPLSAEEKAQLEQLKKSAENAETGKK